MKVFSVNYEVFKRIYIYLISLANEGTIFTEHNLDKSLLSGRRLYSSTTKTELYRDIDRAKLNYGMPYKCLLRHLDKKKHLQRQC